MRDEEGRFLRGLGNPRDGAVDRALNRHISWRISRALLPYRVTPNQVTLASVALGVLAAAGLARPGVAWPVAGALLLQLSAVLDCVDGEIARAKLLESRTGARLDEAADTLVHLATFAGIALHAWPHLGSVAAFALYACFATGGRIAMPSATATGPGTASSRSSPCSGSVR